MRRWSWLLVLSACGGDEVLAPALDPPYVPPAERCEPTDREQLRRFADCNAGGGIFGEWQLDELGLPSYYYGLDQHRDARAAYQISEVGPDGARLLRRDHWAAFGNDRINAMASNDGSIEVVTQDRGVEYLNKLAPEQGNHAGGFGYLDDGEAVWSTAYRDRPYGAKTSRRFGMGYAETAIEHRGISARRIVSAPPGDAPLLVSDVTLHNRSERERIVAHYEVWDVGRRPIEINWLVSGEVATGAPQSARDVRDQRNDLFDERVAYHPPRRLLGVRRSHRGEPLPPEEPSPVDHYPAEPFLMAIDAPVSDVYVDQRSFFGEGGVARPDAVAERLPGAGTGQGDASGPGSALGQPHVLVLKSVIALAPGEQQRLRYAFGYTRFGAAYDEALARGIPSDVRAAYTDDLRDRLFYFASPSHPELSRELAWHSYQLLASVSYRDYWQTRVVPQGSAYLYLHGADGAARDLGIFAVPLVYAAPDLARDELLLYMGIQRASDGGFAYAFQGHGMIDDAGIHSAPSDLPIFFAWALGEYLGATGDMAFLDRPAPFYPREALPGATVWDHLVAAMRHQLDVVGTGEHGLIRVQTGDWSDGIVVAAPDRELAVDKGESIPNTQMAAAVFPRIADLIEARDPQLSAEIRGHVDGYREALKAQWGGEFFYRAYYGDGEPVGAGSIDLEAQVWALIGDTFAAPGDRTTLVEAIDRDLDAPSPVGASLWKGGQVWPAISGLLTWGYALSDPARAWRHLAENTMVERARNFPEVWSAIWSGPDGASSKSGLAWASQVTPMIDFPVQNNNQHAMPILAALKVAGIAATAAGLRVAPITIDEPFALGCRLLDLRLESDRLEIVYRPPGDSARELELVAPPGRLLATASLDGAPLDLAPGATSVTVIVPAGSAARLSAALVSE